MPTGSRNDPLVTYHFYVDVESVFQGTFRECSALGSSQDVIEYWHAGKAGETRWAKLPGRPKFDDIVLKGGTTADTKKLWEWRKKVEDGNVDDARANGTIWMFDQANTPKASWRFTAAWPSKLKSPGFNAGQNEAAVEELTMPIEGLERVS
ncbi:MAG: phage tail protein [Chloroflexi bacterium]|nr:phage tail protein [Chloroflexota bacterium]